MLRVPEKVDIFRAPTEGSRQSALKWLSSCAVQRLISKFLHRVSATSLDVERQRIVSLLPLVSEHAVSRESGPSTRKG